MLTRPLVLMTTLVSLCAAHAADDPAAALRQQVEAAETAFARTMSDRDHRAFLTHVAEDAVFLNGGKPLRGKTTIGTAWLGYYSGPAPFSWHADQIEVLPSGQLAMTAGPVFGPKGEQIARFYSVWRKDPDGRWRVVFDNGYDTPPCAAQTQSSGG